MFKISITTLILLFFFASCKKADPFPENKDEIYLYYTQQVKETTDLIAKEKFTLDSMVAALPKTNAQSGEMKAAKEKISEQRSILTKAGQKLMFLEISAEKRKAVVKSKYLDSLKPGGATWPDEKEIAIFRSEVNLQTARAQWEKSRGTRTSSKHNPPKTAGEQSPRGESPTSAAAEPPKTAPTLGTSTAPATQSN